MSARDAGGARGARGGVRRRVAALAATLAVAGASAACTSGPVAPPKVTLHLLVGSEVEDLRPLLAAVPDSVGVTVDLVTTGSVQGAQLLADPERRKRFDVAWFASDEPFSLWPASREALDEQSPPLMRSPVILGVHSVVKARLGWGPSSVPWGRIVDAVQHEGLRYAMTRPDLSNSGLSSLVAASTGLADTGLPLARDDLDGLRATLQRFLFGDRLRADSSRQLSDAYLAQFPKGLTCQQMVDQRPQAAYGLFTYESEIRRMQKGQPEGCLTPVYPAEGVLVADYRMNLLKDRPEEVRSAFRRLWGWLYSPGTQQRIVRDTFRRPGNPQVTTAGPAPVAQLRFPADPAVVSKLIELYTHNLRLPSRMVFVLDVSGSMEGQKLARLKGALKALTGTDRQKPSTYFSFLPGEDVVFLPFATTVGPEQRFELPRSGDTGPVLAAISRYVEGLQVRDDTSLYAAVERAYQVVRDRHWLGAPAGQPESPVSIVVLSDGENTCGANYADYQRFRQKLSADEQRVRVHTIAFHGEDASGSGTGTCPGYRPGTGATQAPRPGESAWDRDLRVVAEQTGGHAFTADIAQDDAAGSGGSSGGSGGSGGSSGDGKALTLYDAFWRIRGFQ